MVNDVRDEGGFELTIPWTRSASQRFGVRPTRRSLQGVHESSLPVAHLRYQVLSDILFRLGLVANSLTQCSS